MSIDLGFVALTDAAPLIVAKERGLFAKEGLDVSLHREVSWATVRDKVSAGVFQGAHMLAPLAIAARLGLGAEQADVIAPLSLNAHGATIGVSAQLGAEMKNVSAAGLAQAIANRQGGGGAQVLFATVFPYSMHTYMLRYWAASAGIDPDLDMRIVTAPPTSIVDRLKGEGIDGFSVGAPWGAVCEAQCRAKILLNAGEFWSGGPDKVLGVSETWAHRQPGAMQALLRALLHAMSWAGAPENLDELAGMLAAPHYLGTPPDLIAKRLGKDENSIRFSPAASFPWRSHAAWIVSQMLRWGQAGHRVDLERALECYRPDLYRKAADELGISAPLNDSKIEGAHAEPWTLPGSRGPIPMPRDIFPDGAAFDPNSLNQYAASFAISRVNA